jgi:hypothetical protein
MPVYRYLDLSTAHLTEPEMEAVNARFADVDESTPRVIPHEYGAWVNVPDLRSMPDGDDAIVANYPNVAAVIKRARALDCEWVNFDQDASHDDVLPTYEW